MLGHPNKFSQMDLCYDITVTGTEIVMAAEFIMKF